MKKLAYVVFVLAVFSCGGCKTDKVQQAALENLEAASDPNAWDFGNIKAGEVVRHKFFVVNTSQKSWTITQVVTSCGCTASKIEKTVLAAGEQTPLYVSFNSKGYLGPVRQTVYVHTDDPDNPVVRYFVTVIVE